MLAFQKALSRLTIPGYKIKFLTLQDRETIQKFMNESPDYFLMESGRPAVDEDVRSLLFDLPPASPPENKYVLGLEYNGRLAAIMDVLKDYPESRILWIGLLLIHPDFRGQGLGREILRSLRVTVQKAGVREIRLGVLEENQSALVFWQKLGFKEIERKFYRQFGNKVHSVIVMGKVIC